MKTYTIGRDENCYINFADARISRRHALLKVYPSGKMELVDMSANGTYVNGTRITSNKAFPVKRKDTIVFAYAGQLDWSEIPNPLSWIKWVVCGIVALILIIAAVRIIPNALSGETDIDTTSGYSVQSNSSAESNSDGSVSPSGSVKESDSMPKKNKNWYDRYKRVEPKEKKKGTAENETKEESKKTETNTSENGDSENPIML